LVDQGLWGQKSEKHAHLQKEGGVGLGLEGWKGTEYAQTAEAGAVSDRRKKGGNSVHAGRTQSDTAMWGRGKKRETNTNSGKSLQVDGS